MTERETKKYHSLLITRMEDGSFEVEKKCPNCGNNVKLYSMEGRQTFRLGLHVRGNRTVTVTKCPMCFFTIDFSPDEARVLDYPLQKFRRFFNHIKSTPEWDGTWSKKGLLQEE